MVSYRAGRPSYTLDSFIGELPDLRDEDGKHYPWTPCREFPHAWDEDAEIGQQRRSALLCRTTCPALAACERAMLVMGRAATGVWAGRVLSDDPLPRRVAFSVTVVRHQPRRVRRLPPLPPDIITVIDDQERV